MKTIGLFLSSQFDKLSKREGAKWETQIMRY